MYSVYILKSLKDCRTYVGFSENLSKRIREHNDGKVIATKSRRPLILIHTEKQEDIATTKKREQYWKSGAGRRKLQRYFKEGFPIIK